MVWTAAQTASFFEDGVQMGITNHTRVQLVNEGIEFVDDLGEFTDDDLDQIAKNLGQPGSTFDATINALVPAVPFTIGARSIIRLKSAAVAVRYCETVDRETNQSNMRWPVIKKMVQAWKALKGCTKEYKPDIPNVETHHRGKEQSSNSCTYTTSMGTIQRRHQVH